VAGIFVQVEEYPPLVLKFNSSTPSWTKTIWKSTHLDNLGAEPLSVQALDCCQAGKDAGQERSCPGRMEDTVPANPGMVATHRETQEEDEQALVGLLLLLLQALFVAEHKLAH